MRPQKVKIRKACCQNRRKAFLNPKASFSTGIFFCSAPSEKGKPSLGVLPQRVTASGRQCLRIASSGFLASHKGHLRKASLFCIKNCRFRGAAQLWPGGFEEMACEKARQSVRIAVFRVHQAQKASAQIGVFLRQHVFMAGPFATWHADAHLQPSLGT